MNANACSTIESDGEDALVLPLPDEIVAAFGLSEDDVMDIEVADGALVIRKMALAET